MLEHQKIILSNVKDDKRVFRKELHKTLRWISDTDLKHLRSWLYENFDETHQKIIDEVLSEEAA
ncbi:MAG: hypothetical protein GVY19_05870 [Bacteroidetes bacterium]|jgi:hypothetical protein|nr:hypothetical protein [Bacteroidota bacterium]